MGRSSAFHHPIAVPAGYYDDDLPDDFDERADAVWDEFCDEYGPDGVCEACGGGVDNHGIAPDENGRPAVVCLDD